MDNAIKIVILAVSVIIISVLVVAAFSLVNSGQSLLSVGQSQVNASVQEFSDLAVTQFVGAGNSGYDVILAANSHWKVNDDVMVVVCTKDGAIRIYDYNGLWDSAWSSDKDEFEAAATTDCRGKKLTLDYVNSRLNAGDSDKYKAKHVTKYNNGTSTAYSESLKAGDAGYVVRTANFTGSVQRDKNGNVRILTFVQN
jgi:hypothetical protein